MSLKGWLWLIGGVSAAGLFIYFMKIKEAVEKLSFSLSKVDFNSALSTSNAAGLIVTLAITNPTTTVLSFGRIKGQLLINGLTIVDFDYMATVRIPNGTTLLQVPVTVPINSAGGGIANAISQIFTGTTLPDVKFKGYVYVSGVPVPINTAFDIGKVVSINGIVQKGIGIHGVSSY